MGIGLVLSANVLRRLPWGVVAATRRLLTPHPSQMDLAGGGGSGSCSSAAKISDTRREPLLPKAQLAQAGGAGEEQGGARVGGGNRRQ